MEPRAQRVQVRGRGRGASSERDARKKRPKQEQSRVRRRGGGTDPGPRLGDLAQQGRVADSERGEGLQDLHLPAHRQRGAGIPVLGRPPEVSGAERWAADALRRRGCRLQGHAAADRETPLDAAGARAGDLRRLRAPETRRLRGGGRARENRK